MDNIIDFKLENDLNNIEDIFNEANDAIVRTITICIGQENSDNLDLMSAFLGISPENIFLEAYYKYIEELNFKQEGGVIKWIHTNGKVEKR